MEHISSQSKKIKRIKFERNFKIFKDNRLYAKKSKSKSGGSARLPLMTESVDANLRNVMPPTMQTVENVKSLKHDGSQ